MWRVTVTMCCFIAVGSAIKTTTKTNNVDPLNYALPDFPQLADHQDSASECPDLADKRRLSVVPGVGWDNLVNEERGPTIQMESYTKCLKSSDGKFLIPDDVMVEPLKSSDLELTSDVYDSTSEYKSTTAFSINSAVDVGTSFFHMNGDFSFEKESLRGKTSVTRGLVVRSQLRHHRYTVYLIPDSTLHPRFRNRLLDIAAHLARGNVTTHVIDEFDKGEADAGSFINRAGEKDVGTAELIAFEEGLRAFYLADLLVRDFGTHSISSVDVGGILVKTDTLNEDSVRMEKRDRDKLAISASAAFSDTLSVKSGIALNVNETLVDSYRKKVSHSRIQSYGGPIFHAHDLSLENWENGLEDQLVAIDRSGSPIHELITSRSLPELDEDIVLRLSQTVKSAVKRYYMANAVIGCMDPTSVYYDDKANVAAPDCTGKDVQPKISNRLPFGGVFQTCKGPGELCKPLELKNPATGDFTCPQGYLAVRLLPQQLRNCINKCEPGTWNKKPDCRQVCAVTETSWCSLDPSIPEPPVMQEDVGFIFGGVYTDKDTNPVTHQFNCPEYSWPLGIGKHLRICVSTDRELGARYSMPFGGFYSCRFGNPLVSVLDDNTTTANVRSALKEFLNEPSNKLEMQGRASVSENFGFQAADPVDDYSSLFSTAWPRRCPKGYAGHLIVVEDTCQVHYCIPANMLKGKERRVLKRPPFVAPPTLYRRFDSNGKETRLADVPTTMPGINEEQLERLDGDWVRSAQFGIPNRRVQLEQRTKMSIVLGSLLSVATVALIITLGFTVRLIRRRPVHHPL